MPHRPNQAHFRLVALQLSPTRAQYLQAIRSFLRTPKPMPFQLPFQPPLRHLDRLECRLVERKALLLTLHCLQAPNLPFLPFQPFLVLPLLNQRAEHLVLHLKDPRAIRRVLHQLPLELSLARLPLSRPQAQDTWCHLRQPLMPPTSIALLGLRAI